jgi:hypothetical protein
MEINMKEKTIEELEQELEQMKSFHRSAWETYGSELCAGDMLRQEDELQKKIQRSKEILKLRENGLIDENKNLIPSVSLTGKTGLSGIEQLRKIKEETINRWEKSGLLEGLEGNLDKNLAAMFESKTSHIINEDDSYCTDVKPKEAYSREEVITIIKRYAFHLSDNGDPDENAKDWFDRQYPIK